jgi:sugar lactone lactonase YvrE
MKLLANRANLSLTAASILVMAISARSASAQTNPYHLDENWGTQEIAGVESVAIDHTGKIYATARCQELWSGSCTISQRPPIVVVDPATGKVTGGFGAKMFVFIHGLYVDKDNNLWATDAKGYKDKGQQVFKFSPEGKVLMTLGKAGVAGDGQDTFHAPNTVAVAANGDIFVEDGHGLDSNARIVQLSKDGKFIKEFGKKGSGPGEFDKLHGMAIDSQGRLFVCDYAKRIQVFNQNGDLLDVWNQFGVCAGITIDSHDMLYASSGNIGGEGAGIHIGSAKDGVVKYFIPADGHTPVGMAVDAEGNLYVADPETWKIEKYVKK